MIYSAHLLSDVIKPALSHLSSLSSSFNSLSAQNLMLGTVKQESSGGKYLRQINGPALGIFQIEPNTHSDIFENFLKYRPEWESHLVRLASKKFYQNRDDELIFNLRYACAIARLVYWRSPDTIPEQDDVRGLAKMWKSVYNTKFGAGTEEEFINNYTRR